jgi:hypothetical protein
VKTETWREEEDELVTKKRFTTTETYKILRDFLSSRALEVSRMRSALDVERLLFGGMDALSMLYSQRVFENL